MNDITQVIKGIEKLSQEIGHQIHLMEVCGTHTQVISRHGIRGLLPKNINLVTGPGCPVCVTAQQDIDAIVNLAKAGIPVASYGDVFRVPGAFGSLDAAREGGAKVFDVYSVEEALVLKKEYPDIVFFGLGFDTTAPATAYAIQNGLTVYSAHKLFIPAMKALLEIGEVHIDGFIDPGHVSAIIGVEPYKSMNVAQVITGFEVHDVLVGIYMLLLQIKEGRTDVENEYVRVVKDSGNEAARKLIFDVFDVEKTSSTKPSANIWRGFGEIPGSGLMIKKKYQKYDAKVKYKNVLDAVDFSRSKEPPGCQCGEVIRGLKKPDQCPMFGKVCTPDNPVGPCMVSVEGACNNFFREK